jgi:hypothetical protein
MLGSGSKLLMGMCMSLRSGGQAEILYIGLHEEWMLHAVRFGINASMYWTWGLAAAAGMPQGTLMCGFCKNACIPLRCRAWYSNFALGTRVRARSSSAASLQVVVILVR